MTLTKKLTKSEFRQRADKILMCLSLEVTPFWADSEEKHKQRIERAAGDPLYFCRTISPTAPRLFTMIWWGCWSSGTMRW